MTTNERRLAKLLRAGYHDAFSYGNAAETLAAYLAKHGVLAVSWETVPEDETDAQVDAALAATDALERAEAIAEAAKKYVSSDRFTSDYAAFKDVVEKNQ